MVRQYMACVIDLLGMGIKFWCILLHYVYKPFRSYLPTFCAIPIFHILKFSFPSLLLACLATHCSLCVNMVFPMLSYINIPIPIVLAVVRECIVYQHSNYASTIVIFYCCSYQICVYQSSICEVHGCASFFILL